MRCRSWGTRQNSTKIRSIASKNVIPADAEIQRTFPVSKKTIAVCGDTLSFLMRTVHWFPAFAGTTVNVGGEKPPLRMRYVRWVPACAEMTTKARHRRSPNIHLKTLLRPQILMFFSSLPACRRNILSRRTPLFFRSRRNNRSCPWRLNSTATPYKPGQARPAVPL